MRRYTLLCAAVLVAACAEFPTTPSASPDVAPIRSSTTFARQDGGFGANGGPSLRANCVTEHVGELGWHKVEIYWRAPFLPASPAHPIGITYWRVAENGLPHPMPVASSGRLDDGSTYWAQNYQPDGTYLIEVRQGHAGERAQRQQVSCGVRPPDPPPAQPTPTPPVYCLDSVNSCAPPPPECAMGPQKREFDDDWTDDCNNGHGNDPDGDDDGNPGRGGGPA